MNATYRRFADGAIEAQFSKSVICIDLIRYAMGVAAASLDVVDWSLLLWMLAIDISVLLVAAPFAYSEATRNAERRNKAIAFSYYAREIIRLLRSVGKLQWAPDSSLEAIVSRAAVIRKVQREYECDLALRTDMKPILAL